MNEQFRQRTSRKTKHRIDLENIFQKTTTQQHNYFADRNPRSHKNVNPVVVQ